MKLSVAATLTLLQLCGICAYAQDAGNSTPTNTVATNATIEVERIELGTGKPGTQGFEPAFLVVGNLYHVPGYLPGFPTSRTIWPRVVDLPCTSDGTVTHCNGFHWAPSMGRGEYIYFRPVVLANVAPPAPTR